MFRLAKRFLSVGVFLLLIVILTGSANSQDITVHEGTPISLVANSNYGAPDMTEFPCGSMDDYCTGGTVPPNGFVHWSVDGSPVNYTYSYPVSSTEACAYGGAGRTIYCDYYWLESGYTAVLSPGMHTVTAWIPESQDPYAAFTSVWTVNVIPNKRQPSISLSCSPNPIAYGSQNTTCSSSQSAGTGLLSWTIDGVGWTTTGVNGSAVGFAGKEPGDYTVGVTYLGDDSYSPVSKSTVLSINKATPNVSVSLSPSTINFGDNFTASVHVDCNSSCGLVDYRFDGGEWGTVALDQNGNFSAPNSSHSAGVHTIQINYLGSSRYNPSSGSAVLTVNKATPPLSLSCSPNPLTLGYEDAVCAASQPYGTGTLSWSIDGRSWTTTGVNGSVAGFTASPDGNYTISAAYSGDSNSNPTSASTVLKVESSGSLEQLTAIRGTPVNLVAYSNYGAPDLTELPCGNMDGYCTGGTVPPNGSIKWMVDGVPVSATYSTVDSESYDCAYSNMGRPIYCYNYRSESGYTASLPLGVHRVSAWLPSSQDPYAAFISSWLITVVKPTPTLSVNCLPNPIMFGSQTTTCTASQSAGTGLLSWTINGGNWTSTGVNGSAGGFAGWAPGKYTVGVSYPGDTDYAPASATTVLSINKSNPTVSLSLSPANISFGDTFTANVHVDCNTNCGSVDLKFDGAEWTTALLDQSGNFSASNSSHDGGQHIVQVFYLGSDKYNPSTNSATLTVGKINPSLSVTCSPSTITVGSQNVTCVASQSSGTGTLSWSVNGTPWKETGVNGSITGFDNSPSGTYAITVNYSGDASFNATAASTTFKIDPLDKEVYSYQIKNSFGESGFSPEGNIVAFTDSVTGTWALGYDGLDRLTNGTNPGQQEPYYCWYYDPFGNRKAQKQSNSPFHGTECEPASNGTLTNTWANYDTYNHITVGSFRGVTVPPVYDDAGNITDDGTNSYLYDAEGRLCAAKTPAPAGGKIMTQYLYNASGQRVGKGTITTWSCDTDTNGFSLTNEYILGPSNEQLTELDGGGKMIHTNVVASGSLIATNDAAGVHFRLTDWLGSTRVQTNYKGVPELNCSSSPFGDAQPCGSVTEHFYTGKERDIESQNDYFGARYYASSMGRWMSPDWSSAPAAVPYADLGNPQSLNLYTYGSNNPLSHRDEDGHCDIDGEHHNKIWCFFHKLGLAETKHEQANDLRTFYQGITYTPKGGAPVEVDKMSDADLLQFNKDHRRELGAAHWSIAHAVLTSWGWSGTKAYEDAVNQLNKVNTPEGTADHEELNGKIPTRDEAMRMIEESGGKVTRGEEAGHGPNSVSHHKYRHIHYETETGAKGTVRIKE